MQEDTVMNNIPTIEDTSPTTARTENLPKFLIIRPNPSKAAVQKLSPLRAICI